MTIKNRLTLLLILCMTGISSISFGQGTKESKVTIELIYKDANGKKHSEVKEYIGKEADTFDVDAYEKALEQRDIEILNLNINQSVTETSKEELHEEHEHEIKIKRKGEKGKKSVTVKKIIISDSDDIKMKESIESDTYKVEEKDGKIFINGEEVEGGSKQIRIVKSMDADDDMKVEVKDGMVFINGKKVNESEMNLSPERRVIIKKMNIGEPREYSDHVIIEKNIEVDSDDTKNIWITKEGHELDLKKMSINQDDIKNTMVFISDNESKKPRLGIMIEDGKTVNGAEIIDLVPDSPAAKAGLQKGDTVTAINNEPVYGVTSMMDQVSNFKTGDDVDVTYSRDGKTMTSTIKLKMMDTKIEKNVFIKDEKH